MVRSSSLLCVNILLLLLLIVTLSSGELIRTSEYVQNNTPEKYNVTIETGWLTMPDGIHLSVTYFFPMGKIPGEKFPVLLELLPYRKDDMFYIRDYPIGMYFAEHGYVLARVDIRGTGSSEGIVPPSEYSNEEISDAVEIIDQLHAMPWSTGNVGMYGISWSGFNSLMTASRNPSALKAIIAVHSSQDLFYNDCHYIDGVFHMDSYEIQIDTDNAAPQSDDYLITPQYLDERFYQEPWIFTWKRQQTDGPLWKNESLRNKPALSIPVYVIGGLLDGYRDTVPWIINSTSTPVLAEIGPWNHAWPNDGTPGPNYEWQKKAILWFDYWLKGEKSGILYNPQFMTYVRDACPPSLTTEVTPGSWKCGEWPVEKTTLVRYYPLSHNNLSETIPAGNSSQNLTYKAGAGMAAGGWWGELTGNMSTDDTASMVFDTEPLADPVEIIGMPEISLAVAADAPLYHWTIRLEDVWPDGNVSLVSGVLINPTHRISRDNPEYLVPGQNFTLNSRIHYTTWTFRPGHRIRLAISNAQFPMAWPTPYNGNTTIFLGPGSWITLPVIPHGVMNKVCVIPPPEPRKSRTDAEYLNSTMNNSPTYYNPVTGDAVYTQETDDTWRIQDRIFRTKEHYVWNVNDNEPANASFFAEKTDIFTLPERELILEAGCNLISNKTLFNLSFTRRLTENKVVIAEKTWNEKIPRRFQ
jgi:putative CocE/NonD family hydrolase